MAEEVRGSWVPPPVVVVIKGDMRQNSYGVDQDYSYCDDCGCKIRLSGLYAHDGRVFCRDLDFCKRGRRVREEALEQFEASQLEGTNVHAVIEDVMHGRKLQHRKVAAEYYKAHAKEISSKHRRRKPRLARTCVCGADMSSKRPHAKFCTEKCGKKARR